MLDKLIFPLYALAGFTPCALLCYQPFYGNLRIGRKKLFILIFLLFMIQFIFNFSTGAALVKYSGLNFGMFISFYLIVYFLTVKMHHAKLLFVFFMVANYEGLILGVSNFIDLQFFPHTAHINGYSYPLIIIILSVFAVTLPIIEYLFAKIKPLLTEVTTNVWNILWVIPAAFVMTLLVFECSSRNDRMENWQYLTIVLAMAVASTFVYHTVLQMLSQTYENFILKETVHATDMQLNLQKKMYDNLSLKIEETRKARHDLRHHLSVITAFAQSDDMEALKKYLEEYKSSLPDDTQLTICENYAVNAIIQHYVSIAKAEKIEVTLNVNLPSKTGAADSDLCIIFGNCLENAVEACRRMDGEEKYLRIKCSPRGNTLGIAIDNSYNGQIREEDGIFYSSKRKNEEGIGLSSVKAICKKYGGTALFTYNGNEFQSSVVLNFLPQPQQDMKKAG